LKVTTVEFSLITGMMLGFEYVSPDAHPDGAHALVIDILFVRILIQHGNIEDY
jgi:hypothetical protein